MRPVLDRHLPEPYRAWIDKAAPLPEGVRLLPRSTRVAPMVRRLIFPGLVFAGLGVFFIALVTATPDWVEGTTSLVFLVLNSVILFSVPLWSARRLVVTLRARNEQLAGLLRQGILVGTQGVLVRLEPDCCYPIPLGRFVRARQRCGDVDDGTDRLEIETRHGRTEVAADDLAVDAEAIDQAVAFARRCGSGS